MMVMVLVLAMMIISLMRVAGEDGHSDEAMRCPLHVRRPKDEED